MAGRAIESVARGAKKRGRKIAEWEREKRGVREVRKGRARKGNTEKERKVVEERETGK